MTSETQKNALLEEFQQFLQQDAAPGFSPDEQPDLNTLLMEMAGLKTEVKAESRQFKNTLDTLGTALAAVQEDNKALSEELRASSERMQQRQDEVMRTLLLEMVDIQDRLLGGLEVLRNYHPGTALFRRSRKKDVNFIRQLQEGQAMTARRFAQLLQRHHVTPLECIDKPFDPVTMHAVETDHDPERENGIVLAEVRKGFLYRGQVLRQAEVRVNKTELYGKTRHE